MALFLRGDVWWMEYRTRSVRKVVSTGFRRRDAAKARMAWQAFRLAFALRPPRAAVDGILGAIYGGAEEDAGRGVALDALWDEYAAWGAGKGRSVSAKTERWQREVVSRFAEWAKGRGAKDAEDVTVPLARAFVASLGVSNKTLRNYCGCLSQVWGAVGQLRHGLHDPWKAACPDRDGSSTRRAAFTDAQIAAILAEAGRVGHGWRLACVLALYTGLRYGDVATLDWKDVDLERRLVSVTPRKTRRSSGVALVLPMAGPLHRELAEAARGGTEGFVLPEHGAKYTAGSTPQPVDPPFSAILKACGIEGGEYTFHSWRHTANTRMAEAGVPSAVRQMICGWTNDAMARHYDHATHMGELVDAVGKI